MGANDKQELIILLLLEARFHDREDYYEMFGREYNCDKINDRFNELLDKFLNEYALNNTEKSEENL